MNFLPTEISNVLIIEPTVFADDRGLFYDFNQQVFATRTAVKAHFIQDNHIYNLYGGLHYQTQQVQGLVSVIAEAIYDVVAHECHIAWNDSDLAIDWPRLKQF